MNIITVGSYCAGALISDLLNGVRSPFETSVIKSRWNHILKASDDGSFLHLVLPEHTQEWIKKTVNAGTMFDQLFSVEETPVVNTDEVIEDSDDAMLEVLE